MLFYYSLSLLNNKSHTQKKKKEKKKRLFNLSVIPFPLQNRRTCNNIQTQYIGQSRRSTAATEANPESSRSHAIFVITLHRTVAGKTTGNTEALTHGHTNTLTQTHTQTNTATQPQQTHTHTHTRTHKNTRTNTYTQRHTPHIHTQRANCS
jgi:hypothetical protein